MNLKLVSGLGALLVSWASVAWGGPSYQAVNLYPDATGGVIMLGAGGGKQVGNDATDNQPYLWSGSAASRINLTPNSTVFGTDGAHQVGYILAPVQHAPLWSGSAGSVVDLHPSFAQNSDAISVWGNQQVGYGTVASSAYPSGQTHGLLWTGTAASAVDLQPSFGSESEASATDGAQQVGYVNYYATGLFGSAHQGAVLWIGTAASAVDLRPAGYTDSWASGVSNGIQVGYADNATGVQAMMWKGTAASALDLNPTGFQQSEALAVSNGIAVGWGSAQDLGMIGHAIVWDLNTGTVTDLNQILPADLQPFGSQAVGVDANGNIVGNAYDANGKQVPYLWTPVPEPGELAGFASLTSLLTRPRRRPLKSC